MSLPQAPAVDTTVYRDGLITLSDSVRAFFRAQNLDIRVPPVGLRSRSEWPTQRVVFIDGEFDGTFEPKSLKAGRLAPPEHTKSDNPRELQTWERVCTVCVYAFDKVNKASEEAQIQAASNLLQWTVRGMWNAYRPATQGPDGTKEFGFAGQASLDFSQGSVTRVLPPVEIAGGIELLVVFTQKGPLYDLPIPVVFGATPVLTKNFTNLKSSP